MMGTCFSFHRLLSRKKTRAEKYLLLLDGSGLTSGELLTVSIAIRNFRQATGIPVAVFKSPEMLAVKLKGILSKFAQEQ